MCHDASFYPVLVSFHFRIAYRKVRNLQISINKLVGMASINLLHTLSLLHHTKLAACVISIIVDEQIDLTSVFVTTAVLSYQYVIVNKRL